MSYVQIELANGRIENVFVSMIDDGWLAEGAGVEAEGRDEFEALSALCDELGAEVL